MEISHRVGTTVVSAGRSVRMLMAAHICSVRYGGRLLLLVGIDPAVSPAIHTGGDRFTGLPLINNSSSSITGATNFLLPLSHDIYSSVFTCHSLVGRTRLHNSMLVLQAQRVIEHHLVAIAWIAVLANLNRDHITRC